MRKIVLIGGHGYVGRAVTKKLLGDLLFKSASGSDSTLIQLCSRSPSNADAAFRSSLKSAFEDEIGSNQNASISQESVSQWLDRHLLPSARCDITEPGQIDQVCDGATDIVNLVGIMDENPPKYTFESVQHQGARNVAETVCKLRKTQPNVKLIHLSAIGADIESDIPYPRTKALGEKAIHDLLGKVDETGLPSGFIIRPGLILGRDDQFLNRFHLLTKYLPAFPLFGGGQSLYQPIYCKDLAHIIVNCLQTDWKKEMKFPSGNQVVTVEVGGPTVHTFADLVYKTTRRADETSSIAKYLPPYFFPLPVPLALVQAYFMEKLFQPGSMLRLSRDQIKLLQLGNRIIPEKEGGEVPVFKLVQPDRGLDSSALHKSLFCGISQPKSVDDVYRAGKWID